MSISMRVLRAELVRVVERHETAVAEVERLREETARLQTLLDLVIRSSLDFNVPLKLVKE